MHIQSWCGNLKETDHLEDLFVGGMILKWIFKEYDGTAYSGFIDCETNKWWAVVNKEARGMS